MGNERRKRRLAIALALTSASGALALLALGGIGDSLVYYWSPSELLQPSNRAPGATVRLGGLVAPGSIQRDDSLQLHFRVTDGSETVAVRTRNVPPAMFREGIGVVVEGRLDAGGVFEAHRLMVKHDNEYRPPEAEDSRDLRQRLDALEPGGNA